MKKKYKRSKRQIENKEIKLFLLAYDMIMYVESLKEKTIKKKKPFK